MFRWGGKRYEWIVFAAALLALLMYDISISVPVRCPVPKYIYSTTDETTCELCYTSTPGVPYDEPLGNLNLQLGRWDNSRRYRTFDYAAVGDLYTEMSATRQVSLATHSSIESVKEILNITAHWSGPISLAVYVAADEMKLLRGFVTWLINCQPDTYSRLGIHVVTPHEKPAVLQDTPDWARNCSEKPIPSLQRSEETLMWRARDKYPQNVLRNLARKNCHTPYVYLVDVDIVPCKGMAESLDKFLETVKACGKCAFAIPTYELDWNSTFPMNKAELLKLIKKKQAVAYHSKVFTANQQSSELHKWESRNDKPSTKTYVSHNVSAYRLLYEPFYVALDNVPPHDERFVGYGSTRNSQVYEMFLQGYQFKVLSPIFTIHWGLQSKKRPKWRMKQVWKNYKKFLTFRKELYARYNKDPLHLFTGKNDKTISNLDNMKVNDSVIILGNK